MGAIKRPPLIENSRSAQTTMSVHHHNYYVLILNSRPRLQPELDITLTRIRTSGNQPIERHLDTLMGTSGNPASGRHLHIRQGMMTDYCIEPDLLIRQGMMMHYCVAPNLLIRREMTMHYCVEPDLHIRQGILKKMLGNHDLEAHPEKGTWILTKKS